MIRLNKLLAEAGVAARRKADQFIAAGAVQVNGKPAHIGELIDPHVDSITLFGRQIQPPPARHRTLVLNKPAGVVTTMRDERGRPSVAQFIPKGRRLFPVGRLDAATTGVLLVTSDGALAKLLTHPSHGVERQYEVIARGELRPNNAAALRASQVRRLAGGDYSFTLTLREGKNRQVRRMCAQQGLRVIALRRSRFGPVTLRGLKPGRIRPLTEFESRELERIRKA